MPQAIKTCRVCGKEYRACLTPNTANIFRWRDVACSPGCGAEYLRRIELSRAVNSETDVRYNEDVNGFCNSPEDEYINGFGSDE